MSSGWKLKGQYGEGLASPYWQAQREGGEFTNVYWRNWSSLLIGREPLIDIG